MFIILRPFLYKDYVLNEVMDMTEVSNLRTVILQINLE